MIKICIAFLAFSALMCVAGLVLAVWLVLSGEDTSGCVLGPPVLLPAGNGVMVPTYPFMECPE